MTKEKDDIVIETSMVQSLYSHQLISKQAFEYAYPLIQPEKHWGLWMGRLLSGVGVSLILAGIIFFFAFNWNAIPSLAKLGIVEFAILASLGSAFLSRLSTQLGKYFVLGACVLIGVFFAVFGQIYQTGANAYQLFFAWGVLILPWVIISEYAPIWGLWIIIANLSYIFYFLTDIGSVVNHHPIIYVTYLGLLNSALLGLRELAVYHFKLTWLKPRWTRTFLLLPSLLFLSLPIYVFIMEKYVSFTQISGMSTGVFFHLLYYFIYQSKLPDTHGVSYVIISATLVLEAWVVHSLGNFAFNDLGGLLLSGLLTLGIFSVMIKFLLVTLKK